MGKIFYLMGMSSTGKDTIYKLIMKRGDMRLKAIVPYTTRPIRDGETEGVQYHFVNDDDYQLLKKSGFVIEDRVYHTVHGDWRYFTVDDGSVNLEEGSYLAIGTLESYESFKKYYGESQVIALYLYIDDGERLTRALRRELKPENRKFQEMCRRFLADSEDFSEDKIRAAGISLKQRFENVDRELTVDNICKYINEVSQ